MPIPYFAKMNPKYNGTHFHKSSMGLGTMSGIELRNVSLFLLKVGIAYGAVVENKMQVHQNCYHFYPHTLP